MTSPNIARALYASLVAADAINDCGPYEELGDFMREALEAVADQMARATIAAIEASGTHCVVPVEPTEEMRVVGAYVRENRKPVADIYISMCAARPRDIAPTDPEHE